MPENRFCFSKSLKFRLTILTFRFIIILIQYIIALKVTFLRILGKAVFYEPSPHSYENRESHENPFGDRKSVLHHRGDLLRFRCRRIVLSVFTAGALRRVLIRPRFSRSPVRRRRARRLLRLALSLQPLRASQ